MIPEKKGIRGRKPAIPRVLNTLSARPVIKKKKKFSLPAIPSVLNTLSARVDSLSSSIQGWKLIKVRNTERGHKKVNFKAIKVWRRQNNLPCEKPLWLLISKDVESNLSLTEAYI